MAEIAILPFADHPRVAALFEHPAYAEGSQAWFESLAESTLDAGEEAILAVVIEDGSAKAALPLVRKGNAMRALTAPYTTIYAPALPDPKWARYLGERAATYVRGALHLDACDPADSGLSAYLKGLGSSGLIAAQYSHFVSHYEHMRDFDEYWKARPTRLKATVRRKLVQANAQSAEFRCYREDLGHALAMYGEVYRTSWKQSEPHPQFIPNMVERLARDGFVRLGVMTLTGRPVAAQIWLVCGRRATIFKLAHRQDAMHFSPGTLLTHWMASALIREDGLEEIDFGRGGDPYKHNWLKESRPRIGIVAGNWKKMSGLIAIVREVLPSRLSALVRQKLAHSKLT